MKHVFPSLIALLVMSIHLYAQNETWADDVACIVYNNCTKCHHPGGIAPNSFLTYQDVYQKRASIRIYVQDRIMPPSPALPGEVPFRNDNLLSQEEVNTIVNWILNGAPSGDLATAPPPPTIPDAEEISAPDAVLQLEPYTSHAQFEDDYRCFAFETAFGEDKWVNGIEVVPGNKSIVHHAILFQDDNDVVLNLDQNDPLSGYSCFGGVGSFSASFIGGWVPGQTATFTPDGMGLLIPAGTNLIIQTHYPEGSNGMIDSTKVNLSFVDDVSSIRQIRVVPLINHFTSITNGPLFIPANTVKTFHAEATVVANASLLGVLPHMHLLGKSMYCYAVTPQKDTIVLFDIPQWDFEWQLAYQYKQLIHLPFGSKVYADATYDNTSNNLNNPSFPPVDVSVGEATTDEMFLIFFSYLIYQPGDENLEFPDGAPLSESCSATSAVEPVHHLAIQLSPNPADNVVRIQAPWPDYRVTVYDLYGRLMMQTQNVTEIPTDRLSEGVYLIRLDHGKESVTEKIMIAHSHH